MTEHPPHHAAEPDHHGRHELAPDEPAPQIGDLHAGGVKGVARSGRSQLMFGALGVVLCLLRLLLGLLRVPLSLLVHLLSFRGGLLRLSLGLLGRVRVL